MKVVILAGGLGTRLSEETSLRPKPMVEIGGKPILWHIMKIYSHYGFNDFVVCLGYKGYMIKEYFANYFLHTSSVTIDLQENRVETHDSRTEPWKVTLVDTGADTMTGGRIKRIKQFVGNDTFMMTYGDGVGTVDIPALLATHRACKRYATVTATQRPGRFGLLDFDAKGAVTSFEEKPLGDGGWINGGFFVLEPQVFDYVEGDATIWEREPMVRLARDNQMAAFRHEGFWYPMDALRDKVYLEELWTRREAPWKIWRD